MSRPEFRHAVWHTSSRSHGNGDCVAVAFTGWRASTRSHGNGNCVEVAAAGALVGVRDSKDPAGPVLVVDPAGWTTFLVGIRRGEYS